MGFAAYLRSKSRARGGRPRIGKEVRDVIRRMSIEFSLNAHDALYDRRRDEMSLDEVERVVI
jgi:hypothetical protein